MKRKPLLYATIFMTVCSITAISSYSLTTALFKQGASNVAFNLRQSGMRTVTLYTDFDGSEWGSANVINVAVGDTIDSATNPTKSGYDFLGWRTTAPDESNHSSQFSTSQINSTVMSESNLTYYPVFKSSQEKAYVDSIYYAVNTDVQINANSIGNTSIGYTYLGVDGIYDVTATWNSTRNLFSSSGVYRFRDVGGGAYLERKIGFKPNSSWGAAWDGTSCGFGIHTWISDTDDNASAHIGNTTSGNTIYTYIPANHDYFMFSRYSSNNNAYTNPQDDGCKSSNLSFDSSWWWNGSSTNKYSKDTIVLQMNSWGDWVNSWGSDKATWVAS